MVGGVNGKVWREEREERNVTIILKLKHRNTKYGPTIRTPVTNSSGDFLINFRSA